MASVRHMASLGGSVLVSGYFPLEEAIPPVDQVTDTLLVDAATGTIVQRWNRLGEQSIADPVGTIVASPTACTPVDDAYSSYEVWRFVARSATHAIGYGRPTTVGADQAYPVCDYAVTGSGLAARLSATSLGTLTPQRSPDLAQPLPTELYAGHILVGSFDAFDIDTGVQLNWHPSPSSGFVSVAVAGSSIAIVGALTFLHGTAAVHVAALDKNLAPVVGFQSGLSVPDSSQDSFRGLALDGLRVVVIGRLLGPGGATHMVALDKKSGNVTWSAPSSPTTFPTSIAVNPSTGAAYVGMGFGSNTLWAISPRGGRRRDAAGPRPIVRACVHADRRGWRGRLDARVDRRAAVCRRDLQRDRWPGAAGARTDRCRRRLGRVGAQAGHRDASASRRDDRRPA